MTLLRPSLGPARAPLRSRAAQLAPDTARQGGGSDVQAAHCASGKLTVAKSLRGQKPKVARKPVRYRFERSGPRVRNSIDDAKVESNGDNVAQGVACRFQQSAQLQSGPFLATEHH